MANDYLDKTVISIHKQLIANDCRVLNNLYDYVTSITDGGIEEMHRNIITTGGGTFELTSVAKLRIIAQILPIAKIQGAEFHMSHELETIAALDRDQLDYLECRLIHDDPDSIECKAIKSFFKE